MTNDNGITELDLLAYADGRLEPARARQVEAALARDPELRAKVADFAQQNRELAAQFDAYGQAPLPERLAHVLARNEDRPQRHQVRQTLVRAAAVVLVALAAGTGGWTLGRLDARRSAGGTGGEVLAGAAALHETAPDQASATAVGAPGQPLTWFTDRVAMELQLPDLRDEGFALVGKERVNLAGTQGVRLRYTAPGGRRLDVFLKSRWAERASPIATRREGDVTLAHWRRGPLRVVVAGDDDAGRTVTRLATALRTRLEAQHGRPDERAPDLEPQGPTTEARETVTRSPQVRPPAETPAGTSANDLIQPATDGRR